MELDKFKETLEKHGYTYEPQEDGTFMTSAPYEFVIRLGEDGTLSDDDQRILFPQINRDV